MSDNKTKHWKESIGVVPGSTRPQPAKPPSPGASTTSGRPESSAAATAAGPRTGPVAHRVGPAPTTPRRESVGSMPPRAGSPTPTTAAPMGTSDATAQILGELPIGSTSFADAVARTLWSSPAPDDLRALALIAGERHRVADAALKDATVRAVGVRHRMEGLARALGRPVLDATILQARAVEWARLARQADEVQQALQAAGSVPGSDVIDAALGLLPTAAELLAEAALAGEVAGIVEAALAGRARELVALAPHVPDIEPLVAALCSKQLRVGDGLYLEALASGSMARRALLDGQRDELRQSRRALTRLAERFDRQVTQTTNAHARDPEGKARLAAWLRYVRDVRQRVHEAITKPARDEEYTTGPTGTAPSAIDPDSAALAMLRDARRGQPAAPEDPAEALAAVQAVAQAATPSVAATALAPARAGVKKWIAWFIGANVLLAVALSVGAAFIETPSNTTPLQAAAFEFDPPLGAVDAFGPVLLATADPEWERLSSEDRRVAAARLVSVAERHGLRAGLLVTGDGTPLATWSPGRPPEVRAW